jgi:hypothetical protein
MASYFIHPRSRFYRLKVKRRGKWVQEPTTIHIDSAGAVRRIKKLVAEENARELAAPVARHGWQWVPEYLTRTFRDKTLLRYTAAWTAIEVWLEIHELLGPADVTFQHARDYPNWRTQVDPSLMKPCKWNTALTEVRVLSKVLQESVQRGHIDGNPCFRLGLKRRDTKVKPEITLVQQAIVETELLKPEIAEWMRRSWTVAMTQGFRLTETAVPIANIDFTPRPGLPGGSLWVRGKGGKIHPAPLHPAVRALADKVIEEGGTILVEFPKSPAKQWWKFFRRIGLEGISFHSTRVTVVTRLLRDGHSKAQTMAYVGHASETVQAVYNRLGAPDVAHLGNSLSVGSAPAKSSDSSPTKTSPT